MAVTEEQVLEIMDTDLTEIEIYPFLVTAQALVDANLLTSGLSTSIQNEVVKYLAAHFACIKSPFAIRKKIGDVEETYGYKGGTGLDSTPYGEMVKMLDSSGILLSVIGNQTVTFGIIDFAQED